MNEINGTDLTCEKLHRIAYGGDAPYQIDLYKKWRKRSSHSFHHFGE